MSVVITPIVAAVVGLLLMIVVIPKVSKLLIQRVENNPSMSTFQKFRLVNFLETLANGSPSSHTRGASFLSLFFLFLIGLQHFFLYIGNGTGAKMIVVGMFVMLVVYLLQE
ncbi:MAG: hypothetical protein P8074_12515 [Anaerolineales bacterium]|jgi:hypothetical protein